jgi:hypothetical protein
MRETPTFSELVAPDVPPLVDGEDDEHAARAMDPARMPTVTAAARDVDRCPIAPRTFFMTLLF